MIDRSYGDICLLVLELRYWRFEKRLMICFGVYDLTILFSSICST